MGSRGSPTSPVIGRCPERSYRGRTTEHTKEAAIPTSRTVLLAGWPETFASFAAAPMSDATRRRLLGCLQTWSAERAASGEAASDSPLAERSVCVGVAAEYLRRLGVRKPACCSSAATLAAESASSTTARSLPIVVKRSGMRRAYVHAPVPPVKLMLYPSRGFLDGCHSGVVPSGGAA